MTKKMPKAAVRPHRPIPTRSPTLGELEDIDRMCIWCIVLSVLSLAVSVTSAIACAWLALR